MKTITGEIVERPTMKLYSVLVIARNCEWQTFCEPSNDPDKAILNSHHWDESYVKILVAVDVPYYEATKENS